jgi:sirohydrochlorin cobaltochelatase
MVNTSYSHQSVLKSLQLPPLPYQRPLLAIGHGTRNERGKQTFLDFVETYQKLDTSRPVIPCFLELTEPTIQKGVEVCVEQGYTDITALPVLLFAARHNKFDVTNELDRSRAPYPQLSFNYGRHFGITPKIIELWRDRLAKLDRPENNPNNISREDTVLLFVGRGSSDPDANGDVCKLARIIWEGSGYKTVETCFIGITHPRLEEGFRRAYMYQAKRVIVLPYFLFTGTLMEKIHNITAQQQEQHTEIEFVSLSEMGIASQLLQVIREREIEAQLGKVAMNCEMCKFRLAAADGDNGHEHHHHHHHHANSDPYAKLEDYHQRIWNTP